MPCFHPVDAYKAPGGGIAFSRKKGYVDLPVKVRCGRCIGCREDRSKAWAIRCVHEAQMHDENCFITLTYSDKNLPYGGTLVKCHFQMFMKRLRKSLGSKKISFLHCGEYGEKLQRPHYHALLFGHDFSDKVLWKRSPNLYTSATLSQLWPMGFSTVGALTFESAAYVARYTMKKMVGREHYERILDTGEIFNLLPEYITCSIRPGIGRRWIEQFKSDVYPSDEVVINGGKLRPPKYYDKRLELDDSELSKRIKWNRHGGPAKDETPERLAVREEVKLSKIQLLKRTI